MRVIVFFDLPTITDQNKREYRKFRKMLIQNGFIMLQESVYIKLVLNQSIKNSVLSLLKKNKPPEGMVQALVITEKQFSNMVNISGTIKNDIVDSDERLLII